jgi:hypothetical protein
MAGTNDEKGEIMHKKNLQPKLKAAIGQSKFQRFVMRTVCLLLGHNWGTYGWTGNTYWPTKGKECKTCKLRKPWDA